METISSPLLLCGSQAVIHVFTVDVIAAHLVLVLCCRAVNHAHTVIEPGTSSVSSQKKYYYEYRCGADHQPKFRLGAKNRPLTSTT